MKPIYVVSVMIFSFILIGCEKEIRTLFLDFKKPDYFPQPVYRFQQNPITKNGFELGRKLFFDPILSADNTISCGSCHIPSTAFTHHGHSVSHGINDKLGTRNSPPIMNLAWVPSFMWDGGIADLDLQPIAPITSHIEMGEQMDNVLNKLRSSPTYPALFSAAFPGSEISNANMLKALSQYMLMCVSAESKYDSVMRKEKVFSAEEQQGYTIFISKCNTCHTEPLFTDNSFRNNGLLPRLRDDEGRKLITLRDEDAYKFKVPSLRNLEYTPPYMHDGRFYSLDAVLDHYTTQVAVTPTLDPILQQDGHVGITLSTEERRLLKIFLKTLNDKHFVTNPQIAEP
ncbi:MAG: cytochrome-c peroxidase [bacterium]|jgi:cytochrome c peroxidase